MQKIKKIILFIFMITLLTSCAKVEYILDVREDGTADLVYSLEVDEQEFEKYEDKYSTTISALKTTLEQDGFSVNINNTEKALFEAKLYIEDINNINDYNTLFLPISNEKPIFSYINNFFSKKYEINAKIDLTSYSDSKREQTNDEFLSENLPIDFILNVPGKIKESNTEIVDGEKLKWELKYGEVNEITAKYEILNWTRLIILIVILFVVAQVITIKLVITIKKHHIK